jgi:hypothetical protein
VEKTAFPVYRRYQDTDTWFEIHSEQSFDELKIMGSRFALVHFEARILPDRNFIYDLIHCNHQGIMVVSGNDFKQTLQDAQSKLLQVEI